MSLVLTYLLLFPPARCRSMSESKQDQPHSGDEGGGGVGGGASRTPALEEPLLDDRKEDGLVDDDDASRPVPTPESIVPVREEEPLLLDDGAPPQQGVRNSPPRRGATSNDEPGPGGKCATTAEACFKKIAKSTVGKIMLLGVLFAAGFVVGLTSLKAQIATSRPRSTP